jgi:tRNA(Arg) A34 adenosine deaminase TadA
MDIDDVGYFRIARDAAEKSENPEHRIGAVVCNKKPLGVGWNMWEKSNPRVQALLPGRRKRLHAEMHACQGLSISELKGGCLYVVRLSPAGNVRLAMPCRECLDFLSSRGVRKVYYSTNGAYGVLRWSASCQSWEKTI